MHIVDGALSAPVLLMGGAATLAGCALGLKKMDMDHIPQVGLLSAAFFLASLIHVPIGPSSVHLVLNGLVGLILGWTAFPALLVGLLLQAVFFGFGGIVVLGVNALNIALPAVAVHYLFRGRLNRAAESGQSGSKGATSGRATFIWAFAAGSMGIVLTTTLVALSLALSGDAFMAAAQLLFYAHMPVMILEGFLTAAAVGLIIKVLPEMFHLPEQLHGIPDADTPAPTNPDTTKPHRASKAQDAVTAGLVALFFMIPATGSAHNIIADAYVEGNTIEGEVGYGNGDAVANAPVTVTDPQGKALGTTSTDAEGIFIFQVTQRVEHHFAVDAGAGHVARMVVAADDLPSNLAQGAASTKGTSSPALQSNMPGIPSIPITQEAKETNGAQETNGAAPSATVNAPGGTNNPTAANLPASIDAAALQAMVDKSIARQIKPLRKQILQYENKVRLHDILGGLGYILGLTGLGMWYASRNPRSGRNGAPSDGKEA